MAAKALEISVNGERLYVVGASEWRALHAQVWGNRIPADFFTRENWPESEELPESDVEHVDLLASVSTPNPSYGSNSGRNRDASKQYLTESYETRRLEVGDVITIKLIETGSPDRPNGPKPDPRHLGRTVALKIANSD